MDFEFQAWYWLVIGILFILFELILPSFAAFWFGIAAIIVGCITLLFPSLSLATQIALWAILSVLCTVAWFKWIKPLSFDKTSAGMAREATIGQTGMVISIHDNALCTVRFSIPVMSSDEWLCRCEQPLQVGDRVTVIDILGNELLVKPTPSNNQTHSTL